MISLSQNKYVSYLKLNLFYIENGREVSAYFISSRHHILYKAGFKCIRRFSSCEIDAERQKVFTRLTVHYRNTL